MSSSKMNLSTRQVYRADLPSRVIQGKVEYITLPDGITHVDIIVSEWMGYALLYESMLDSVLVARDRFLKSGEETGIMAPSQCQMMLALCDASEVRKDRVDFWGDIYGKARTQLNLIPTKYIS